MKKFIATIIILTIISLNFSSSCWDKYIDIFETTLIKYHPILKNNETKKKIMLGKINMLRNEINDDTKDLEVLLKMQEIINLLNDDHSRIVLYDSIFYYYPVDIVPVGNDFMVWKISGKYNYLLYSKLIKINNRPIEKVKAEFKRILSHETENGLKAKFATNVVKYEYLSYLGITSQEDVVFTFEKNGKEYNVKLSPFNGDSMQSIENYPEIYKYQIDPVTWKYYEKEKTMYIRISKFKYDSKKLSDKIIDNFGNINNEEYKKYLDFINNQYECFDKDLDSIFKEVDNKEIKKIIVDVRENSGGYELWRNLLDRFYNRRYQFEEKGSLIVLLDKYSYSSSVKFACEARKNFSILLIGEEPGGKLNMYGNSIVKDLNFCAASISVATKFFDEDKKNSYLKPDIEVLPKISDIEKGIDTVLEYALKYK